MHLRLLPRMHLQLLTWKLTRWDLRQVKGSSGVGGCLAPPQHWFFLLMGCWRRRPATIDPAGALACLYKVDRTRLRWDGSSRSQTGGRVLSWAGSSRAPPPRASAAWSGARSCGGRLCQARRDPPPGMCTWCQLHSFAYPDRSRSRNVTRAN